MMRASPLCVLSLFLVASPFARSYVTDTKTGIKKICAHHAVSFMPPASQAFLFPRTLPLADSPRRYGVVKLSSSVSDDDDVKDAAPTPKRSRRRAVRRKDDVGETKGSAEVTAPPPPPEAPTTPSMEDVTIKVQDIRDILGGPGSAKPKRDEDGADKDVVVRSVTESFGDGGSSGSFDELLADARRMREASKGSVDEDSEGNGIVLPENVIDAVSTIVTVDFFVVCGFLIWFLVGIFSSTVLQNDAIQIAFNSNFQLLVQPALGILMIGSVAGAIFKKEKKAE